ncbi:Na+/H+ antiporter NhaA [Kocuria rhizophila]|nr:Na+/H+ antiporter NhaA [Kocuria rhizophila]
MVDDLLAITHHRDFSTTRCTRRRSSHSFRWPCSGPWRTASPARCAPHAGRVVILVPLAVMTWALVDEAGIYATVAGAPLASPFPVIGAQASGSPWSFGRAPRARVRPLSAGFGAGLRCSRGRRGGPLDQLTTALAAPVTLGIIAGLLGGRWRRSRRVAHHRAHRANWTRPTSGSTWSGGEPGRDRVTVSLLIAELSFNRPRPPGTGRVAVLTASVLAAVLAGLLLAARNHAGYRRAAEPPLRRPCPDPSARRLPAQGCWLVPAPG